MAMYVYPNGMGNDGIMIDLQPGDLVIHKLNNWKGILGPCYRKLNKCYVELEDGSTIQTFITSLKKAN